MHSGFIMFLKQVYSIHFWSLVMVPYKTLGGLTASNRWELISDGRVPMAYCMVMR